MISLIDTPVWDIPAYVNQIAGMIGNLPKPIARKKKRCPGFTDPVSVAYYDIPAAFDIETTNFTDPETGDPATVMYVWQLGIMGLVCMGRTWDQFKDLLGRLRDALDLSVTRRLLVYVHYLGFEFQNFRHYLEWDEIFALDVREPVSALSGGIEFRCSYKLSGYGLGKLGDELHYHKITKASGELDYDLLHHSGTPLTAEEIDYCVRDVLVVMAYIDEEIAREGHITRLPLTKTGYVRKYVRRACLYPRKDKEGRESRLYKLLMRNMVMTPDEYRQLRRAFCGGFTHASARMADRTLRDVDSIDFTSAYPYVMIAYQYPMSRAKLVERIGDDLPYYLVHYCCLLDIRLEGVTPRINNDHYLSSSKCHYDRSATVVDNGRIVRSSWIETTVTDIDLRIIRRFYNWDKLLAANLRIYTRGYLPTPFVRVVLDLYEAKTSLKGVEGKEIEYTVAKGMLNALYGCCVMDPCRPEYLYDAGVWLDPKEPDLNEAIEKYNEDKKRAFPYPWGVWVTAYCRYNLLTSICAIGDDYIYADTDSIKLQNWDRHAAFVAAYNQRVERRLRRAMEYHKIDFDRVCPKTVKGEAKMLGVWDHETAKAKYTRFKTLGAKRYITEQEGRISITVSGVNKREAVPYLLEKYGPDHVFDEFRDGLEIPPGKTGKLTHLYIDEPMRGTITDYLGNTADYEQLSGVHLSPCGYSLSMQAYLDYLRGLRDVPDPS